MKIFKKSLLVLGALLTLISTGLLGHALSYGYFSARQIADDYERYGGSVAYIKFVQNVPRPLGYKSFYYHYGAAIWAETKILTAKKAQESHLRLIHGIALLPYTQNTLEAIQQDVNSSNIIKKGYVSLLASELMQIADARRCRAEILEEKILDLAETHLTAISSYEKILTKILTRQQIESLWQEALSVEKDNAERPLALSVCISTDVQMQKIIDLGGQEVLLQTPGGHPLPMTVLQPAPKNLPWTMPQTEWNTARQKIREESYARWLRRFEANADQP
jgi:hypothetical protein